VFKPDKFSNSASVFGNFDQLIKASRIGESFYFKGRVELMPQNCYTSLTGNKNCGTRLRMFLRYGKRFPEMDVGA